MGPKTRAEYWGRVAQWRARGATDGGGDRVSTAARAPRVSERAVEEKREEFRNQYGDNFTRDTADKVLKESDTPEIRAAAALELSASPATREEAKHLLSQFKDIVPDIPRVMKRMINAFALRQAIGILEGSSVSTAVLARWTILEHKIPVLADLLASIQNGWITSQKR